ncbi:MAG TPA: hypothetical protein VJ417_10410, partial [Candidatus Glassbacteria bacterium]|nr:hypothetical protein [Candidatus Glassbacteria bacterium]
RGRVLPVKLGQANLTGAFLPDSKPPLAIIIMDDAGIPAGPVVARYAVLKTAVAARHLVTGLAGSGNYAVQAKSAGDKFEVNVSLGEDITASAEGTLLFEISPEGKARPVPVKVWPAAQDVAAAISKGSE